MNAPTPLEDRLAAALGARADLVQADDLRPASPPATVTPLRRRAHPTLYVAAAAASVAAVATLAVGLGTDDSAPVPAVPSVPTASEPTTAPTSTPPTSTAPGGLLPEDDPAYVGPGEQVRFPSGATGRLEGDDLVIADAGAERRVSLGELTPQGRASARLSGVEVRLGRAGVGYLVSIGDPESPLVRLYAPTRGDALVLVATPGDVPFGAGFTEDGAGYLTWTTGDGAELWTRVMVGDPSLQKYRVYRWEVPGRDAGGGPDGPGVELVADQVATVCFDFADNTSATC